MDEERTEQTAEQPRRGRQSSQEPKQEQGDEKKPVTFEGSKGKVMITATNPVMIATLKNAGLEQK